MGRVIAFAYDAMNRLASTTDPRGAITALAYDAVGNRTSLTDPVGNMTAWTYDELNRPIVETDPLNKSREFPDDAVGNRTSVALVLAGVPDLVNSYQFDAADRMSRVEQQSGGPAGAPVAPKRVDFTYDAAGRYETIARYASPAAAVPVVQSTYAFDAAGRLVSLDHRQGAVTLAGYAWNYDAVDRLVQTVSTADGSADYTYDAADQLTAAAYAYE